MIDWAKVHELADDYFNAHPCGVPWHHGVHLCSEVEREQARRLAAK